MKKRHRSFTHKSAYRLLTYKSKDGKIKETVWNSRDGSIPFMIATVDGTPLYHSDWHLNEEPRKENYKLKERQRYITNLTKERALYLAMIIVKKGWKKGLRRTYRGLTRKEVVFMLAKQHYGDGTAWTLLRHGKDTTKYLTYYFRHYPATSKSR